MFALGKYPAYHVSRYNKVWLRCCPAKKKNSRRIPTATSAVKLEGLRSHSLSYRHSLILEKKKKKKVSSQYAATEQTYGIGKRTIFTLELDDSWSIYSRRHQCFLSQLLARFPPTEFGTSSPNPTWFRVMDCLDLCDLDSRVHEMNA